MGWGSSSTRHAFDTWSGTFLSRVRLGPRLRKAHDAMSDMIWFVFWGAFFIKKKYCKLTPHFLKNCGSSTFILRAISRKFHRVISSVGSCYVVPFCFSGRFMWYPFNGRQVHELLIFALLPLSNPVYGFGIITANQKGSAKILILTFFLNYITMNISSNVFLAVAMIGIHQCLRWEKKMFLGQWCYMSRVVSISLDASCVHHMIRASFSKCFCWVHELCSCVKPKKTVGSTSIERPPSNLNVLVSWKKDGGAPKIWGWLV